MFLTKTQEQLIIALSDEGWTMTDIDKLIINIKAVRSFLKNKTKPPRSARSKKDDKNISQNK